MFFVLFAKAATTN